MKCVILQPSYIPWRGYFHQIYKADLFVFYDDVPYDKHGWRNRNRIKTANGPQWLTIPVLAKGVYSGQVLNADVRISWNTDWAKKHQAGLRYAYAKAPYYARYEPLLESFYARRPEFLTDWTIDLTIALARELGIGHTQFIRSSTLQTQGTKTERVLNVLQAVGATHYISGPSAQSYLDLEQFAGAGITVEYMHYDYPEYPQLYPPFDPQVSILDLLFMMGPEAEGYIWGSDAPVRS